MLFHSFTLLPGSRTASLMHLEILDVISTKRWLKRIYLFIIDFLNNYFMGCYSQ